MLISETAWNGRQDSADSAVGVWWRCADSPARGEAEVWDVGDPKGDSAVRPEAVRP